MFENATTIYIIEEVKGGGLKKFIDNFKKEYNNKNIININSIIDVNFEKDDILFINNLYFTNIEIEDILKLNIKIILCLHDFYWMHEFVMRKFFNDEYPPVHTNYLRDNIIIDENIIKLFKKAHKVIYPSKFVYNNYKKYFDVSNFIYKPHNDDIVDYSNNLMLKINNNIINVGVLHSLTKCKGYELINYLRCNIKNYNGYEINYLVVGENMDRYDENDNLSDIIIKHNIHFATCLNIWGETYSYYLTKIINSGIPLLYNNIGAIKERIIENKKYIKVFDDEKNVYDYEFLKIKFYEMLDYIIKQDYE
jgi:hypothetical protein